MFQLWQLRHFLLGEEWKLIQLSSKVLVHTHQVLILLSCICVKSFEPNCIVWYEEGKWCFWKKRKLCHSNLWEWHFRKKIIRDPSSTLCSASYRTVVHSVKKEKITLIFKIFRENSIECNSVLYVLISRDFWWKNHESKFPKFPHCASSRYLWWKTTSCFPFDGLFLPQEIFFSRSHPPKEKYLQFSKNILTHHKSFHEIFLLFHVLIATNSISDFNDDCDFGHRLFYVVIWRIKETRTVN